MAHRNLTRLMDRWNTDPAFRAELRQDPATAVARLGVTLDVDEQAALAAVDWSLTDEQLAERASAFV